MTIADRIVEKLDQELAVLFENPHDVPSSALAKTNEISYVGILRTCVDIRFKDGSRLFISNKSDYLDGLNYETKDELWPS